MLSEITRGSFDLADPDTKLGFLFDICHNTRQEVCLIKVKLARKLFVDKIYLGICGFLGGLTATIPLILVYFKVI